MTMAASHAELEHLLQRRPYDRIARLMEAASRHVTDMQMNSPLSGGAVATFAMRHAIARPRVHIGLADISTRPTRQAASGETDVHAASISGRACSARSCHS